MTMILIIVRLIKSIYLPVCWILYSLAIIVVALNKYVTEIC